MADRSETCFFSDIATRIEIDTSAGDSRLWKTYHSTWLQSAPGGRSRVCEKVKVEKQKLPVGVRPEQNWVIPLQCFGRGATSRFVVRWADRQTDTIKWANDFYGFEWTAVKAKPDVRGLIRANTFNCWTGLSFIAIFLRRTQKSAAYQQESVQN